MFDDYIYIYSLIYIFNTSLPKGLYTCYISSYYSVVTTMSKKGFFKGAVASLALLAFGSACELGCYKPLSPNEMAEPDPVITSAEPCPDSFDGYSAEEVISLVQTPEDAVKYITWASQERVQGHPFFNDKYTNNGYRTNSFKKFHDTYSTEVWDCTEEALGTLAMLSDNGYPAYFLNMGSLTGADAVPVCKKDGKFSILYYPEQYDSIDELVAKKGYSTWLLIDLNKQRKKDWKTGEDNYFDFFGSVQTYLPSTRN